MKFRAEAHQWIAQELERGESARREGFEGRARVCARRAAGAAVREYLALRGSDLPQTSAYDLLSMLRDLPEISVTTWQRVERLLAQVNEDFALPEDVDLLADARGLVSDLESISGVE